MENKDIKLTYKLLKNYIHKDKKNIFNEISERLSLKNKDKNQQANLLYKKILKDEYDISGHVIKLLIKDLISEQNEKIITFQKQNKKFYLIGDLHQDLFSLNKILETVDFINNYSNIHLVFLGDYIDRGDDKIHLINKLIILKFLFPDNITLLRGNHELYKKENGEYHTIMANPDDSYHFEILTAINNNPDEYKHLISQGYDKELIILYAKFFDSLPVLSLFDFPEIRILGVHGGLPRFRKLEAKNVEELLNQKDDIGISQYWNMLWSDPYDDNEKFYKLTSAIRFKFSKSQFIEFCKKYNIDMIIRSHEAFKEGFKTFYDERLISIFSNGNKDDEYQTINERSAYSLVRPAFVQINEDNIIIKSIFGKPLKKISFNKIKYIREQQELNYHPQTLNNIKLKCKNYYLIYDYHNSDIKKFFKVDENKIAKFNFNSLNQDFYGIFPDFSMILNIETSEIINTGKIPFKIGLNGQTILPKQKITINDNFILDLGVNQFVICWKKSSN